jgi:hypothetical protein
MKSGALMEEISSLLGKDTAHSSPSFLHCEDKVRWRPYTTQNRGPTRAGLCWLPNPRLQPQGYGK